MTTPGTPLTESAASLLDQAIILAETATGYRARLEAAGWSPTAAEQVAQHFLMSMQAVAFKATGAA